MISVRLAWLIVLTVAVPALAAPPPRPLAGKGVVSIATGGTRSDTAVLYERPGVRRVAELPLQKLPHIGPTGEETLVPVLEEKAEWLRVVFDDAGREGWLKRERSWKTTAWEALFKGRFTKMLPGLRAPFYAVRKSPSDKAEQAVALTPAKRFRILRVQGNWGQILLDFTVAGWVKWHDEDGRLLVSVE